MHEIDPPREPGTDHLLHAVETACASGDIDGALDLILGAVDAHDWAAAEAFCQRLDLGRTDDSVGLALLGVTLSAAPGDVPSRSSFARRLRARLAGRLGRREAELATLGLADRS